jgi:hypothetical protein
MYEPVNGDLLCVGLGAWLLLFVQTRKQSRKSAEGNAPSKAALQRTVQLRNIPSHQPSVVEL